MKKGNIFIAGLLINSVTVLAETLPGIPGEITLPDNFLTNALQPILQKIGLFVGGIFGIYVIFAVLQFYRERKKIRLLQDIRNDLDLLANHFGVKHSHARKGILRRVLDIFHSDEANKKKKREK